MRRDSDDLFEQPREVIFRQVRRRSNLIQRKTARIIVVHELEGPAEPAIDGPGSRQLDKV